MMGIYCKDALGEQGSWLRLQIVLHVDKLAGIVTVPAKDGKKQLSYLKIFEQFCPTKAMHKLFNLP